jgi:hypothetical protein
VRKADGLAVRERGYRGRMPHWIALFAIVVAGWMVVTVAGGLMAGRVLRAIQDSRLGSRVRVRQRLRRAA